jgi:hypothetical protein
MLSPEAPHEAIMGRKFWLSTLAVFVVAMVSHFLLHVVLLHGDYAQIQGLLRTSPDSQHYAPWMILAQVMICGGFVWIYQRGREDKPWVGQGLRFGLVIALFTVVPTYLITFVEQPMPQALVIKQIAFDGVRQLVLGLVVAWMNR